MYSVPDLEPVCCSMSGSVSSLLAYRFLRRWVRWSDTPISLRIFTVLVMHKVKGFSVASEAKVDVFLEFSWFFYDPMSVGNLISDFSAFSKSSLYIWKFLFLASPKLDACHQANKNNSNKLGEFSLFFRFKKQMNKEFKQINMWKKIISQYKF